MTEPRPEDNETVPDVRNDPIPESMPTDDGGPEPREKENP
jgi:hypothetical protein